VAADVVEVSPPYDVAEITALAAATLVYDLTSLMAKQVTADSHSAFSSHAP
jgi:arginase family enzyme